MSREPSCPTCDAESECLEYDPDDDVYRMRCEGDPEHEFWWVNDDEVWK